MKPSLPLATHSDDEPTDAKHEVFLKCTDLDEPTFHRLRLEAESLPQIDLDDWFGVFVGGSPFNASTPAEKKSTTQERVEIKLFGLLDRVVATDFPFSGVCYGVGTPTRHQGMIIDTTYGEAVAAPDVILTEAGLVGPICAGVSEVFQVLVAHKEVVTTLSPHAAVLGIDETRPAQTFRIGSNLYVTQFHLELDGDYLTHRLGFYASHGYSVDDELVGLQARVHLDDVSDFWKLLVNSVSVHVRD